MKLTAEIKTTSQEGGTFRVVYAQLQMSNNCNISKRITDKNYARFGDGIFKIKMEEEYENHFTVPKEFEELQIQAVSEQTKAIQQVCMTIALCY